MKVAAAAYQESPSEGGAKIKFLIPRFSGRQLSKSLMWGTFIFTKNPFVNVYFPCVSKIKWPEKASITCQIKDSQFTWLLVVSDQNSIGSLEYQTLQGFRPF